MTESENRNALQELESINLEDGNIIRCFQLTSGSETVQVCNLGASIVQYNTSAACTDSTKSSRNIVLGYKDLTAMYHEQNPAYLGVIVGRVANRITNGQFYLDKKTYTLDCNNGEHHLHGGNTGFSRRLWTVEETGVLQDGTIPFVRFILDSPDGDQGYPGHVQISATYSLRPNSYSDGTTLRLEMQAQLVLPTTQGKKKSPPLSTPINLAQHSYFCLTDVTDDAGILDHTVHLNADSYTPPHPGTCIPARQVQSVEQDPWMNFTKPRTVRDAMTALMNSSTTSDSVSGEQFQTDLQTRRPSTPYGFDHNYVVRSQPAMFLPEVGTLSNQDLTLTVSSTAPGVQLYTGNYLSPDENIEYRAWSGLCLETQHFPASLLTSAKESLPKEFAKGACPILSKRSPTYEHIIEYTLVPTSSSAGSNTAGTDTGGKAYPSIANMWNHQNMQTWYTQSKEYYEDYCAPTVNGVLGGIGSISPIDLEGSRSFVNQVFDKLGDATRSMCLSGAAAECGAGIGRVSKGLLLDLCKSSDLIEGSSHLLSAAPDYIGPNASRCRFYCAELQEWQPTSKKYALIWIQWSAIYLTDKDFCILLRRCAKALIPGGIIILKENTCEESTFVVDVDDASLTRSTAYWRNLIGQAGLAVVLEQQQKDFPDDIFPVYQWALQAGVASLS
eukprot:Nitzschia sp. Nitz4//scaffold405_size10492//5666//7743//NITZ4_009072-RA/size10492-augustus-gene-0.3-mRNA-1//-1//CDS//3329551115//5966//frame0